MNSLAQRFFYHSFPRRGRDTESVNEKGLQILASMAQSGLLLTPENPREWRETLMDGTKGAPVVLLQKRVCFTELAEQELARHSNSFGPFAIEFSIENLRVLGAIPAFYLPLPATQNKGLSGVSATMVVRMGEVEEALSRMSNMAAVLRTAANKNEQISVTKNNKTIRSTRCTVGGAEDLMSMIFEEIRPPEELLNAVRAMAGFFCPTGEIGDDDGLAYYREREWRIIANVVRGTTETTRDLTAAEKQTLIGIDEPFFERKLTVRTGEHRRADLCKYFSQLDGLHVLPPCHSSCRLDRTVTCGA